ncbi:LolA family protein [Hirschia litorea]|uniref:Outer membrane lipoprotein carrier protein LolA n=1 Tax=Hirschia litorea TaxID=1199156 RepID=A0ABW2IN50_9PROT
MIIASYLIPIFISFDALALAGPAQEAVANPTQHVQNEQSELSPEQLKDAASTELSGDDILKKINSRMSETTSARGGFVQTDALGEVTTGNFYLRRPGRVRFEYTSPTPYLIVSDGTTVAIEDKELDTIDRAPLSATPLKHFLKTNLDFSTDTSVLDIRTLPDSHLVVLEDNPKDGEEALDGLVFLKFNKENFDLIGWVTIDGLGNETRVDLIDMELNVKISPRLFVLEDEDNRDRR